MGSSLLTPAFWLKPLFLCAVNLGPHNSLSPRSLSKMGMRDGGGVGSVCPSCFISEVVQTTQHLLNLVRQRQVILTSSDGNLPLVPDSDCPTLAPGPPSCVYQDSRKPAHKISPGRKALGQSWVSHTVLQRLGWYFPRWTTSSLTGDTDPHKVRSCRSPRLLPLLCLALRTFHPPPPAPLDSPSRRHCHTCFPRSLLTPGQINGKFESILETWKAELTFLESKRCCCGSGGWFCY